MLARADVSGFISWYRSQDPTAPHAMLLHALRDHGVSGPLLPHFVGTDVYQLWTAESVRAVADWIRPLRLSGWIEVGAGDGLLTRALAAHGVSIRATDDGSWAIQRQDAPRIRVSATAGPAMLGATGVVSSWMPYEADWTPAWRATDSVRAYVLIGEAPPDGCVGTPDAWACPPGWQATVLPGFSDGALARTDRLSDGGAHSGTCAVGYVREEARS